MKKLLVLISLFLANPAVFAQEEVSCLEAKYRVENHDTQNEFNAIFKNFLSQKHHSSNSHSFHVNENFVAISQYTKYREKQSKILEERMGIYEWLVATLKNLPADNVIRVPEEYASNVRFLIRITFQKEIPISTLIEGATLTDDDVSLLQEQAKNELTTFYQNQKLYAAKILKNDDVQTVAFMWNQYCEVEDSPRPYESRLNGTRVTLDIYCIETGTHTNTSFAIANSIEGQHYLHNEFSNKEWVSIKLPFEESNMLTQFWTAGYNRAWRKLGGDSP
ncbi:hypothetical protein LRP49_07060 [Enterovibrio sp. ZSDZ35]|uniref:Uncharacterized protein n=1 Tax=Enterovibrio qingdaonensis TaxID=2899818 RepID=A0ABT5QKF4_9GAMM|nr:hypothetical protein [Enterovibrio sp. ZSDZ35]MDD1780960.1 hypothetical protein [Enterovibrio sp. ZSDZ35]